MIDPGGTIPSEIKPLLDKSDEIQGWLKRLDEFASSAKPDVLERIRNEYLHRLSTNDELLGAYAPQLVEIHRERMASRDALRGDLAVGSEEMEEHRIRRGAGEIDDAELQRRRGETERRIDDVQARIEEESDLLAGLEMVLERLGVAGYGRRGPEPAPPPTPADAAERDVGGDEDENRDARAREAQAEEELARDLAFEPQTEGEAEAVPSGELRPAEGEPSDFDDEDGYVDELEWLEDLGDEQPAFDSVSSLMEEEGDGS